tara:strand:+ start:2641 stop:3492 length:852 start_codon:yes stop_codon:yes gene_type:complete
MVLSYDTSDDRFGAYAKRQQQASLDKYQAPARAWDKLQNLQNQAVAGQLDSAGEQEFKEARRKWNREYKNTPVGIMASGVNLDQNPFGAQDLYHDMSAQLAFDTPKLYDKMYPFNPGKILSVAAENIGPMSWLKRILPKRKRKVPENVLAMRERFPGMINEIIPPSGIAPLIPEHIRRKTVFDLTNEDEGIFGGRGEFSPDFDYDELRRKRRLKYDLEDALEKIMAGEVESFDDMADTKELPEDKQVELTTLLASEEFQALPQYEKERILLEDYGIEIKTGFE